MSTQDPGLREMSLSASISGNRKMYLSMLPVTIGMREGNIFNISDYVAKFMVISLFSSAVDVKIPAFER